MSLRWATRGVGGGHIMTSGHNNNIQDGIAWSTGCLTTKERNMLQMMINNRFCAHKFLSSNDRLINSMFSLLFYGDINYDTFCYVFPK